MAPALSKPFYYVRTSGLFDKLPAAVIIHGLFPFLTASERAELQSRILAPDERIRTEHHVLETLTDDEVTSLNDIVCGKTVMGADWPGHPAHAVRCARIKANLYNPARFICGVRQMYEMLVSKDVLGYKVPHYMSLLSMELMMRQDSEFQLDENMELPRNRLTYKLAWTAAGRFSNISTPLPSRRSSLSSITNVDEDEDDWIHHEDGFDVIDERAVMEFDARLSAQHAREHMLRRMGVPRHVSRRIRDAERAAGADVTDSEDDAATVPAPERREAAAQTDTDEEDLEQPRHRRRIGEVVYHM